jgi:hypothetical protein
VSPGTITARLARMLSVTYWLVLFALHGVWLSEWLANGARPRYGHPKSWQTGILASHRALYAISVPVLLVLFYLAFVCAIWIAVSLVDDALGKRNGFLKPRLGLLVGAGVFIVDPLGAVNWFMD